MIGAWFRSKQRGELGQLKMRAEAYFDTAIDQIKVIDKKDVIRLYHGHDLIESVPDRLLIKHLFCFDNNFHPVINRYPFYTTHINSGEKHYFREDDYIVIFKRGGKALYSPSTDTGFIL